MNNPIISSSLFVTPKSYEDLAQRLNTIGDANEQRIAHLAAMMALNLAKQLVDKEMSLS